MSSDYFDSSDHQQVAATRARASAINNALDAIDTGLALLPTEANIKMGLINYGVDSGIADAYVVTLPYTATALTDGMQVVFKASAVNTGACTINVDALGVKSIKRHDGTDPIAGDIGANQITELRYNSTSATFEIQGSIGAEAGTGTMSSQNANAVAITGGTTADIVDTGSRFNGSLLNEAVALAATSTELNTAADGISNPPIAGDATAGRVLRKFRLLLEDGSAATTVKASIIGEWNETAVAAVDDIANGVPAGGFSFVEGTSYFYVDILDANITETAVFVLSCGIVRNACGVQLNAYGFVTGTAIRVSLYQSPDESNITGSTLVDTGNISVEVLYLTDA